MVKYRKIHNTTNQNYENKVNFNWYSIQPKISGGKRSHHFGRHHDLIKLYGIDFTRLYSCQRISFHCRATSILFLYQLPLPPDMANRIIRQVSIAGTDYPSRTHGLAPVQKFVVLLL